MLNTTFDFCLLEASTLLPMVTSTKTSLYIAKCSVVVKFPKVRNIIPTSFSLLSLVNSYIHFSAHWQCQVPLESLPTFSSKNQIFIALFLLSWYTACVAPPPQITVFVPTDSLMSWLFFLTPSFHANV